MKRLIPFAFVLSTALSFLPNLNVNALPKPVPLQVNIERPTNGQGSHRAPMRVPNLVIDDNILLIPEYYYNCQLQITDEDGFVVYSTTIPEGCDQIELPSYLNGEYEIQLIRGNFCFCGYIEL